jgi:GNAT superfamily N-acetyltransferase
MALAEKIRENVATALKYAAEPVGPVIHIADALARLHWAELYGDEPYQAQLDKVVELERAGGSAYFTARTEAGRIVGQAGFMLFHSPFHNARIAMDVFYYVLPEFRSGGAASALLRFAGESLARSGISNVIATSMVGGKSAALMEKAGYRLSGQTFRFVGA